MCIAVVHGKDVASPCVLNKSPPLAPSVTKSDPDRSAIQEQKIETSNVMMNMEEQGLEGESLSEMEARSSNLILAGLFEVH